MTKFITIIFLFFTFTGFSQTLFDYEKEISNKADFNFIEIEFENKPDKIKLSGTLITPKSDFDKIVVIVPGSGKDTRHSHYVLAEELLKKKIAVYRFDERGTGLSAGKYSESAKSLASDLQFAFKELQSKYSTKKIGILGHSLGGIASLQIIQANTIPAFLILIETPIIKNGDFILNQFDNNYDNSLPEIMKKGKTKEELISFLEGYFSVLYNNDSNSWNKEIKKYIKEKGFNKRFVALLDDEFLVEMIGLNLEETLKNIPKNTLYLTGTKDKIINHSDEINLIKSFNNTNIDFEVYPDLNHWLTVKDAKIGSSLYQMDPNPLSKILSWTIEQ